MNYKYKEKADYIKEKLKSLRPYIYHISTYGSIYIKFKDNELLRSVRIGDHNGRSRYRYKWNLRSDINEKYIDKDKNVIRYYYSFDEIDNLIFHINNYNNKIRSYK